jgi:acetyltransferase-like isoleucine patch superfamily enzyme
MRMLLKLIDKLFYYYWSLKLKHVKFGLKGKNVTIREGFNFFKPSNIFIYDHTYLGPGCFISAFNEVSIKSGTIFGPEVRIYSANHIYKNAESIPYGRQISEDGVLIEENCWIGGNVIINPGTHIGEGSIIGSGSVVRGKIPPFSIVVGNPAQVIRERDREHYLQLKQSDSIYMKIKSSGKT